MFANLKAKLLKVDLRKGGKKLFVFESNVRMSAGELEAINEMIDQEVALGIDSQVISYSVRKNVKTDQPIITYKVNDQGMVEEVKPEGKQLEMSLGLPPEKTPIKEEPAVISRNIVEEFILEGLAPRYPDLEYDFESITRRHAEGESYLRIASELELSSGKLAELLDDYFTRIAPLAAKWEEWRESQRQQVENVIASASAGKEEKKADETEHKADDQEDKDAMELDNDENEAAGHEASGDEVEDGGEEHGAA